MSVRGGSWTEAGSDPTSMEPRASSEAGGLIGEVFSQTVSRCWTHGSHVHLSACAHPPPAMHRCTHHTHTVTRQCTHHINTWAQRIHVGLDSHMCAHALPEPAPATLTLVPDGLGVPWLRPFPRPTVQSAKLSLTVRASNKITHALATPALAVSPCLLWPCSPAVSGQANANPQQCRQTSPLPVPRSQEWDHCGPCPGRSSLFSRAPMTPCPGAQNAFQLPPPEFSWTQTSIQAVPRT